MAPTPTDFPAVQILESRRLFAAGAIDTSFGDDGVASIRANASEARLTDVAVTPDGRVVVTGTTKSDGTLNVARFRADGSLDPTFGAGGRATSRIGSAQVRAVAVQPDHKIVVVGSRGQDYFVLRYNTNGKHDRTFGDGGIVRRTFGQAVSEARDVAILDDGSILVAGTARQANGSTAAGVARFESDGSVDERFGDQGTVVTKFGTPLGDAPSVFVNRMAVRDDLVANDIILAGRWSNGALVPDAGDDAVAVMRLQNDGSIDPTFSDDGLALADFGTIEEEATGVAIDAQGRPVMSIAGTDAFGVLRLRATGSRDTTFGKNGLARASSTHGEAFDVLIDEDERIVLTGVINGASRLDRLLDTGQLDDDFSVGDSSVPVPFRSRSQPVRVALSPDQTYVVAGTGSIDQAPVRFELSKFLIDDGPAARVVSAPELRTRTSGSYVFHVLWRETNGINLSTIGSNDVRVTGPNGYARTAVLVSPPTFTDPTVTARYKVAPPNGTEWTSADNGTYTIHALVGGVLDLQGIPNPAAVLGTFPVNIA